MERKRKMTKYINDDAGPSKIDKVMEEQVIESIHREEDGEPETFDINKLNQSSRNSIHTKIKKEALAEGTVFSIKGYEKHIKKATGNSRYSPYRSHGSEESFTKVTIEVEFNCYDEYNTEDNEVKSKQF